MRKLVVVAAVAAVSACAAPQATPRTLPKERAYECFGSCEMIGMKLSAVVIVMDSAGCVCEPKASPPAASPAPSSSAADGAAGVALVAAEARQQQQQEQQSPVQPTLPRPTTGVPVPRY